MEQQRLSSRVPTDPQSPRNSVPENPQSSDQPSLQSRQNSPGPSRDLTPMFRLMRVVKRYKGADEEGHNQENAELAHFNNQERSEGRFPDPSPSRFSPPAQTDLSATSTEQNQFNNTGNSQPKVPRTVPPKVVNNEAAWLPFLRGPNQTQHPERVTSTTSPAPMIPPSQSYAPLYTPPHRRSTSGLAQQHQQIPGQTGRRQQEQHRGFRGLDRTQRRSSNRLLAQRVIAGDRSINPAWLRANGRRVLRRHLERLDEERKRRY